MNLLNVTHEIPAPKLEVISVDVAAKVSELIQASKFDVKDAESFEKANALLLEIQPHLKEIERRHKELKAPLNELAKAIDGVVKSVLNPLDDAKKSLIESKRKFEEAERRRIAEEQRKAREAAEAEQARLNEIARKQREEAEALAKKEAEEIAAVLGSPVEPAPVAPAAPVPVVKPAPVSSPILSTPSATVTRHVPTLVIDEKHSIFDRFRVGNELLITVNRAAVKRALDAGVSISWARMETVEREAMRSVRS